MIVSFINNVLTIIDRESVFVIMMHLRTQWLPSGKKLMKPYSLTRLIE